MININKTINIWSIITILIYTNYTFGSNLSSQPENLNITINQDKLYIKSGKLEIETKKINNIDTLGIINSNFKNLCDFYEINENLFKKFNTKNEMTYNNSNQTNSEILSAVKKKIENEENFKYYVIYCSNGNSINNNQVTHGLFRETTNINIKMIYSGEELLDLGYLFYNDFTTANIVFLKNFKTSNVTNMQHMFFGCKKLQILNLSNLYFEKVINMSKMFSFCEKLEKVNFGDESNDNSSATKKLTTASCMFYGCTKLNTIIFRNGFFYSGENSLDMSSLFKGCSSLKSINLDKCNIQKVSNIEGMFYGCSKLETIDLGKNSFGNTATGYISLFSGCNSLKKITFYKGYNDCILDAINKLLPNNNEETEQITTDEKITKCTCTK